MEQYIVLLGKIQVIKPKPLLVRFTLQMSPESINQWSI
ncbi:hypothetical protein SE1_01906 [Enterococcus hirae EnGen0127]|nr:hypothetical protein SE1_01906 [Enterococcus hirae EnGen0127]